MQNMRANAPQRMGLWKQYADEYALIEDEVWAAYSDFICHSFGDGMLIGLELDRSFRCRKGEMKYKVSHVHHARDGTDRSRYPSCAYATICTPDRKAGWLCV